MKSKRFWFMRFFWATAIAFTVLMMASLLRGRDVGRAAWESSAWSLIASAAFTGRRYYQARKGMACALCEATQR